MHSEFWREESVNREPGQKINARIPEGIWAEGLQREEKGRDWMRLKNRMWSEKSKSSKIPSISSSKGR